MKIISKNKIAYRDYDIQKEYEAGIILTGHEVKSIKTGQINIKDAIIRITDREAFIVGMDVPLYGKTSRVLVPDYQAKAARKLLLNRVEITKMYLATHKSPEVIVPLELYLNAKGRIKFKIAIGKLRRKVEKKQIIKEKEMDRQMAREVRNYGG